MREVSAVAGRFLPRIPDSAARPAGAIEALDDAYSAALPYVMDLRASIEPTYYTDVEGGDWIAWPAGGMPLHILLQPPHWSNYCLRIVVYGIAFHSLAAGLKIGRDQPLSWRFDCKNGFTKPPRVAPDAAEAALSAYIRSAAAHRRCVP